MMIFMATVAISVSNLLVIITLLLHRSTLLLPSHAVWTMPFLFVYVFRQPRFLHLTNSSRVQKNTKFVYSFYFSFFPWPFLLGGFFYWNSMCWIFLTALSVA